MTTTVYLADDHPMFLAAIVEALTECPEIEVVGSTSSGFDAVDGIDRLQPDVAVIDMRMRGLSGQEVLDAAMARGVRTRIIFLSAHIESDLVYRALAGGAAGYLSKDVDRDAVREAVQAVARGATVLSGEVQGRLAGAIRQRDMHDRPALTPREHAVLALAAEGCSTPEIATRLSVASATVKTHLQSIYTKLDVADRTSAVATALRRGLLE